ncbi:hypothetical protein EAF04_010629 [Stromatinia cepivora]|nr:hypothetical protein EAF04_010629 [Stromatinia cepivora]
MATDFPKFSLLPTEMRRKIWSFCMPESCVFEFDIPHEYLVGTICETALTSIANAKPPIFSQVCRESHDVAFTEGGFLTELLALRKAKGFEELPEFDDVSAVAGIDNPWFCPKTDIVHLNWRQVYNPLFDSDHNPIPALVAHARISQGGSIMAEVVMSFQEEYTYDSSGHPERLSFDESYDNFTLESLNGFKICLLTINIHSTDIQVVDSGLFGSLAAPIQLVDPMDRETIRRMYELWCTTFHDDPKLKDPEPEKIFEEMILTPDNFESRVRMWHEFYEREWVWSKWYKKLHQGTLNTISSPEDVFTGPKFDPEGNAVTGLHVSNIHMPEHDFNKAHPWVQEALDVMPRFHPVIMFRYCSARCHTLGRPQPPKDWGWRSEQMTISFWSST